MTTTCIGCGCDYHHACEDGLSAGCHWLCVDVEHATGICSACPQLVKRWNKGAHYVLQEFTELRVIELLADIYDADEARAWFHSRQKLLGGKQPHALVAAGDVRRVRRYLRGKNLACWCPLGEPCHADILLEIANR